VEKCRAEKLRWESWLWTNHLISTFFFWVSIRSCYLYNFIHILYIFYTYFIHILYIFIQFYTYLYQKFGLLFQSRTGDSTNSSPRFSSAFQIGKTGEDHYMDLKQLGSNTLSESTHHPFRSLCSGSFGDSCCFKTRENLNATRIPWGSARRNTASYQADFTGGIPRAGLLEFCRLLFETARSPPWGFCICLLFGIMIWGQTPHIPGFFRGLKVHIFINDRLVVINLTN
jgi:hypothetical protein